MKTLAATLIILIACGAALAADPPKGPADAKSASKPDTRSDFLRTESAQAGKKPASNVRLNLNAASATELAILPGVGEARAKAIIKGRPYRSKEELLQKKILPADVYENVRSNLYAGK